MEDVPLTPADAADPDAELAAALVADHVANAEVAIIWLADTPEGLRIAYANPNAIEVLGLSSLADARALDPPAGLEQLPAEVSRQLSAPELRNAMGVVVGHPDATHREFDQRLGPRFLARRFAAAGLTGVKLVGRQGDLTDELQRSAQAAQRIMSAFFEHAGVEVFMKDLDGRYVLVNENFRQAWERAGEDLTGHTDAEIVGEELAVRYLAEDRHVLATNAPLEIEGLSDRADGAHVFRVVKFPVHGTDQQIVGVGGVAIDVTEALRSRAALAVSEEQFRLAFDHASEGISIMSLDGRLIQVNDRLCEILGRSREDLIGRPASELYPADRQPRFPEWKGVVRSQGHVAFNRVLPKPDGSEVHIRVSIAVVRDAHSNPVHFVALIADETERLALELRARQSEKLEAVGQLAGGIAHDINNLLGGILGYAELVKAAQTEPELIEQCEQVIGAALRAADYTSRLLSFARPAAQAAERFDVHDIVSEVVHMLRHSIGSEITVVAELGAPYAIVDGNPNQIHGALLNLGLNARDAIRGTGTVTIRTSAGRGTPWSVRIEVTDTGVGIPPERLDRVFDPFYTTKPDGRGTGLGLTSVLAAVHQHHGTVTVDSQPGRGSTFLIELPLAERRLQADPLEGSLVLRPGTRVLVVDDDDVVRHVVTESLRNAGCHVTDAADGVAAIAAIESEEPPPDAVVFDLRMPRMSGEALFDVLHARWPQITTVLMSGFGGDESAEALRGRGLGAVLQKPFRADELIATIARCLPPAAATS